MQLQMLKVSKHFLNKPARHLRVIQGNVVGDCVQIIECRLGPNYFSHLDIRFLAEEWVTTRPSSTGFSPRAIPSRISILF